MPAPKPFNATVNGDFLKKAGLVTFIFVLQAVTASLIIVGTEQGALLPFLACIYMAFIPAILTLMFLGKLHRISTWKRQAVITFLETMVFVLVLLLLLIDPVDTGVVRLLDTSKEFVCTNSFQNVFPFTQALVRISECSGSSDKCDEKSACLGMSYHALHPYFELSGENPQMPGEAMRELGHLMNCDALNKHSPKAVGKVAVLSWTYLGEMRRFSDFKPLANTPAGDVSVEVKFFVYEGTTSWMITHVVVWTVFQELLKFLMVRRIIFKDRVASPPAMLVYSIAIGVSFAAAENLQRSIIHKVLFEEKVSFERMSLSLPLHSITGIMMGISLAYRKMLGRAYGICSMLAIPMILHFVFGFAMLNSSVTAGQCIMGVLCVVAGALFSRISYMALDGVNDVHVRELLLEGVISTPTNCFMESGLCFWIRKHDDPVAAEARLVEEQAASIQAREQGKSQPHPTMVALRTMLRIFIANLYPPTPPCEMQTEAPCSHCNLPTRSHLVHPSTCAYCGIEGAPPPMRDRPSPNAQASGIGY
eukprot:TRINITY_DN38946_c0_g2_i1.p1 TRINITY_DN38946_c0_g2~~TRINITY_DN38946_c0_g2_i1.p1  ORF type:complete len:534 (+),score=57.35 TRINITY_DN38946_c0_g2_i1:118-1719(+)